MISRADAIDLLKRTDADYKRVVKPYLIGKDITTEPSAQPSRWVIDFGSMRLEDAERYGRAVDIVRVRVSHARSRIEAWTFAPGGGSSRARAARCGPPSQA